MSINALFQAGTKPHKLKRLDMEAFVRTDRFIRRCGFEVASLDDLRRQLSSGRVVNETQEDLW